jgi:hypothetical protein
MIPERQFEVNMVRKALQDWTMSDGTFIPRGTFLGVAVAAMDTAEVYIAASEIGMRTDASQPRYLFRNRVHSVDSGSRK